MQTNVYFHYIWCSFIVFYYIMLLVSELSLLRPFTLSPIISTNIYLFLCVSDHTICSALFVRRTKQNNTHTPWPQNSHTSLLNWMYTQLVSLFDRAHFFTHLPSQSDARKRVSLSAKKMHSKWKVGLVAVESDEKIIWSACARAAESNSEKHFWLRSEYIRRH